MGCNNTFEIKFNMNRDEFYDIYCEMGDDKLSSIYGEHLKMLYLNGYGDKPTCIINIYEIYGFRQDAIPILLDIFKIDIKDIEYRIY